MADPIAPVQTTGSSGPQAELSAHASGLATAFHRPETEAPAQPVQTAAPPVPVPPSPPALPGRPAGVDDLLASDGWERLEGTPSAFHAVAPGAEKGADVVQGTAVQAGAAISVPPVPVTVTVVGQAPSPLAFMTTPLARQVEGAAVLVGLAMVFGRLAHTAWERRKLRRRAARIKYDTVRFYGTLSERR